MYSPPVGGTTVVVVVVLLLWALLLAQKTILVRRTEAICRISRLLPVHDDWRNHLDVRLYAGLFFDRIMDLMWPTCFVSSSS